MNATTEFQDNPEKLNELHEKVNAMLDIPVPKEGDEFPLPLEATVAPEEPHGSAPV